MVKDIIHDKDLSFLGLAFLHAARSARLQFSFLLLQTGGVLLDHVKSIQIQRH